MCLQNELEVLGAIIDHNSQVEIILKYLPDNFQQLCLNYNMNNISLFFEVLLNELQTTRTIIKWAPVMSLHVQKGCTSKPKSENKNKKTHNIKKIVTQIGGKKKPKGKCSQWKMLGHWMAHCPSLLVKQKNKSSSSLSLVIETFLVAISTESWCVDSRATDHGNTTLQGFKEMCKLLRGEGSIFQADDSVTLILF